MKSRFSNRLWRAIAWRLRERDNPAAIMLCAKVDLFAVGKRHALTEIYLSEAEQTVLRDLLDTCQDHYWLQITQHEWDNVLGSDIRFELIK